MLPLMKATCRFFFFYKKMVSFEQLQQRIDKILELIDTIEAIGDFVTKSNLKEQFKERILEWCDRRMMFVLQQTLQITKLAILNDFV